MRVSAIFDAKELLAEIAKIKEYRKMMGLSEDIGDKIPLENDIGEPGEIYEGAFIYTNGDEVINTAEKHVKIAHIPGHLGHVYFSNITIDDAYIQYHKEMVYNEVFMEVGGIKRLHVGNHMSVYTWEALGLTNIEEIVIHGDSNGYGEDEFYDVEKLTFDKNCRYICGKFNANYIKSVQRLIKGIITDKDVQQCNAEKFNILDDGTVSIEVEILKKNGVEEIRNVTLPLQEISDNILVDVYSTCLRDYLCDTRILKLEHFGLTIENIRDADE